MKHQPFEITPGWNVLCMVLNKMYGFFFVLVGNP